MSTLAKPTLPKSAGGGAFSQGRNAPSQLLTGTNQPSKGMQHHLCPEMPPPVATSLVPFHHN